MVVGNYLLMPRWGVLKFAGGDFFSLEDEQIFDQWGESLHRSFIDVRLGSKYATKVNWYVSIT